MLSSWTKAQEVMLLWVLCALFLGVCASGGKPKTEKKDRQALARGWGDDINWVETYGEAMEMMVESQKPLMVIHHLMDCQKCQELKAQFASYKPIQKLAQDEFIMLNLVEETSDKNLAPDGYYVPRIIFVDPSKIVRAEITGKYALQRYTYDAVDTVHLYVNMRRALERLEDDKIMHKEL